MARKIISLTESDLKDVVKDCLNEVVLDKTARNLFESSWSRVLQWIDSYDIATISAFRKYLKDVHPHSKIEIPQGMNIGDAFSTKLNRERSKELQRHLIGLGYGTTKLSGSYIEGMGGQDLNEVAEESWLVVNLSNNPNFYNDLFALSEKYNQDSFIYKPKGDQAYLVGTNDAEFPGYKNSVPQGDLTSLPSKFMSRIKNACFAFVNKDKWVVKNDRSDLTASDMEDYENSYSWRNDKESSFEQRKEKRVKKEAEKYWEVAMSYDKAAYEELRKKMQAGVLLKSEKDKYEKLLNYKRILGTFKNKEKYVDFVMQKYRNEHNSNPSLKEELLNECYNDWFNLVKNNGVTLISEKDIKGFSRQALSAYRKI